VAVFGTMIETVTVAVITRNDHIDMVEQPSS
jgi:hypothetical protein